MQSHDGKRSSERRKVGQSSHSVGSGVRRLGRRAGHRRCSRVVVTLEADSQVELNPAGTDGTPTTCICTSLTTGMQEALAGIIVDDGEDSH